MCSKESSLMLQVHSPVSDQSRTGTLVHSAPVCFSDHPIAAPTDVYASL